MTAKSGRAKTIIELSWVFNQVKATCIAALQPEDTFPDEAEPFYFSKLFWLAFFLSKLQQHSSVI